MDCSEETCTQPLYAKGFCRHHYDKNRRPLKGRTPLTDRFWAKVDMSGGGDSCWTWKGKIGHKGYGQFRVNGRRPVAHRVSYQLLVGSIPDGMELDHTCHTRSCVNPKHLQVQTRQGNCQNRKGTNKNSSTAIRGVYQRPNGTYRVIVGHNRKAHHGGTFKSIAEAERAAILLRLRLHENNLVDRRLNIGGSE